MNYKRIFLIGILLTVFLGSICAVSAADCSESYHGDTYMTQDGLAELKSGDLDTGSFEVWADSISDIHGSTELSLDNGETWVVYYKMNIGDTPKIVGAVKTGCVINENKTVVENQTVDGDDVKEDVDQSGFSLDENDPYVSPALKHIIKPGLIGMDKCLKTYGEYIIKMKAWKIVPTKFLYPWWHEEHPNKSLSNITFGYLKEIAKNIHDHCSIVSDFIGVGEELLEYGLGEYPLVVDK